MKSLLSSQKFPQEQWTSPLSTPIESFAKQDPYPFSPEPAQAPEQEEWPLTEEPEVPPEVAGVEGPRPRSGMNILAIISLILAIALSPFAVVFGYLAVGQARRSQQRGEAVAWVAVGIGWLWVVGYVILGAIVFVGWQQVFST